MFQPENDPVSVPRRKSKFTMETKLFVNANRPINTSQTQRKEEKDHIETPFLISIHTFMFYRNKM